MLYLSSFNCVPTSHYRFINIYSVAGSSVFWPGMEERSLHWVQMEMYEEHWHAYTKQDASSFMNHPLRTGVHLDLVPLNNTDTLTILQRKVFL